MNPPQVKISVPEFQILELSLDPSTNEGEILWSDGRRQKVIVVELVYGPQGTWGRLVPTDDPSYIICISQSGKMTPTFYIVHETPVIPETPPTFELPPEQGSEVTG